MNWKQEAPPSTLHNAPYPLRIVVPQGVTIEDVQKPLWWRCNSAAAGNLSPDGAWKKIEVICEDGSWEAEMRVTAVIGDEVYTRTLSHWEEKKKTNLKAPDGYVIEFLQGYGWRVLSPDNRIVVDNLQIKDMAVQAAIDDVRK